MGMGRALIKNGYPHPVRGLWLFSKLVMVEAWARLGAETWSQVNWFVNCFRDEGDLTWEQTN